MAAKIKTVHSDVFPLIGAEKHRENTRRRLFAQCVCQAENEGLVDLFTVKREVTEEPLLTSKKIPAGEHKGKFSVIRMTITAIFAF